MATAVRTWAFIAVAVVTVAVAAGCTEPRSKRCSSVCAREAACRDEIASEDTFDEGECVDACAALERDSHTEKQVAAHVECVRAADDCKAVVACP